MQRNRRGATSPPSPRSTARRFGVALAPSSAPRLMVAGTGEGRQRQRWRALSSHTRHIEMWSGPELTRRETSKPCPTRAGQQNRGPTHPGETVKPRPTGRHGTGVLVALPPKRDSDALRHEQNELLGRARRSRQVLVDELHLDARWRAGPLPKRARASTAPSASHPTRRSSAGTGSPRLR